jgi:chromosome segregation ATPase
MALRTIPRHDPPAQRSAEREALASAISTVAATEQALDAARRSVTRAGDAVRRAEDNLTAARSAIAEARSRHLALLSEAATQGVPPASPAAVREARRREDDALEEVELCRTAEAELRSRLPALEADVQHAVEQRAAAVDAVVRTVAANIFTETEELVEQLLGKRAVLRFLRNLSHPAQSRADIDGRDPQDLILGMIGRLRDDDRSWADHPAVRPFREARARLVSDPDAAID